MMDLNNPNTFDRDTFHKEVIIGACECLNCGGKHYRIWKYYFLSPMGQRTDISGFFCTLICMKNYHENS